MTSTQQGPCAVFTIVKNEPIFLPIWIAHYQKYFSNNDIYVLDHDSNDGSTTNLADGIHVIPIHNEFAFDHEWLRNQVQTFYRHLLEEKQYKCVLFSECDELIYSIDRPLDAVIQQFVEDDDCQYLTCDGYEMMQNLQVEEPALAKHTLTDIVHGRNYWHFNVCYCKTLLAKIPLTWCYGFHSTLPIYLIDHRYPIYLCHLHKYDFAQMLIRHQTRKREWKYHTDITEKGMSYHNAAHEYDDVMKVFLTTHDEAIVPIPEEHKQWLLYSKKTRSHLKINNNMCECR